MPRFFAFAAPLLLGCLVTPAVQAQAPLPAYFYVGADSTALNKGFGAATLTSSGVTASGLYAFINASPATASYRGLSAFSNAQLSVTGGTFQELVADDASTINLVGSNLTESSSYYISPIGDAFYTISGTLQGNQSPFTAGFYAPSTGTLEFNGIAAVRGAPASNPVPEASTIISLGLLLMLGLGAVAVKRRIKPASSPAR